MCGESNVSVGFYYTMNPATAPNLTFISILVFDNEVPSCHYGIACHLMPHQIAHGY